MKMILQLKDVPAGATITKIKGNSLYKVSDIIKIFKQDGSTQTINCDKNTRFIVGDNSCFMNAISNETEVVWIADPLEYFQYLDTLLNAGEDK